jgi:hypothetical protein
VRDTIADFVQQRVKKLQESLSTFATQLRLDLQQCAADLSLPHTPADDEFKSVIRGTPVFDPQPFAIAISRPSFAAFLGRGLTQREIARRIQRQLGSQFQAALDVYWRLLQEWSDSTMRQLKQSFEAYAEDYRAQAEQALSGKALNTEELAAIQRDLSQLAADAARDKSVTNSIRGDASYVRESSSKAV